MYLEEDKRLKLYNAKQIHDMTIDGTTYQDEYVYSFSEKDWIKIKEIPLFKLIKPEFPVSVQTNKKPTFPPPPIDTTEELNNAPHDEVKLLLIYFKELTNKDTGNEHQTVETETSLALKDKEIEALKSKEKDTSQKLQNYKKDYEELNNKNKELELSLQANEDRITQQYETIEKLKESLRNGIRFKTNYEKVDKSCKELENKLRAYQNEIMKNKEFIQELQNANQQRTDKEVKRLTGESYEICNGKVWFYKQSAKEHGPFGFEEILKLKREERVTESTLLKNINTNTGWKTLNDHFEFQTTFETIITQENGEAVKRFFIKRQSIRVPIYDIMCLESNESEFKGYCTSLSLGGCFMELTRLKEGDFEKEDTATVTIMGNILDSQIVTQVCIKNISLSRPRGLGLMFTDLDDNSRKMLEKYISESLSKMGLNKESA
jgi:hypothetical protein